MAAYTRTQIEQRLNISSLVMGTFYKDPMVNYRGKAETGELYTEIIAEFLLANFHLLDQIQTIQRRRPYKVESHKGTTPNSQSNRIEERIAMSMLGNTYPNFGKVVDYQVPLKNQRNDVAGKVDVLSIINGNLLLLELKKPDSKETLLRCILEAYTYWRIMDRDKLKREWGLNEKHSVNCGVLVFSDGSQYREFNSKLIPNTKALMNKLNVGFYSIDPVPASLHVDKYVVIPQNNKP